MVHVNFRNHFSLFLLAPIWDGQWPSVPRRPNKTPQEDIADFVMGGGAVTSESEVDESAEAERSMFFRSLVVPRREKIRQPKWPENPEVLEALVHFNWKLFFFGT